MVNVVPVTGLLMAKQDADADESPAKKDKTENVRLTAGTLKRLRDIVEARGPDWSIAKVVDELLEAELPGVHAHALIQLKKIRAARAAAAAVPRASQRPAAE